MKRFITSGLLLCLLAYCSQIFSGNSCSIQKGHEDRVMTALFEPGAFLYKILHKKVSELNMLYDFGTQVLAKYYAKELCVYLSKADKPYDLIYSIFEKYAQTYKYNIIFMQPNSISLWEKYVNRHGHQLKKEVFFNLASNLAWESDGKKVQDLLGEYVSSGLLSVCAHKLFDFCQKNNKTTKEYLSSWISLKKFYYLLDKGCQSQS